MSARHLEFWAKTPSPTELTTHHDRPKFKPVAHHLIDVGAVALEFLLAQPARLAREARLTGLPPRDHAQLCAWLAALHDLGKISIRHQRLVKDLYPTQILRDIPASDSKCYLHWHLTAVLLCSKQVAPHLGFAVDNDRIAKIIGAVAGHHGVPVSSELSAATGTAAGSLRFANDIGSVCAEIAGELVADLRPLFSPPAFDIQAVAVSPFSFNLNGLITLADWVGSDEDSFPFEPLDVTLDAYFKHALKQARQALTEKGLLPFPLRNNISATSFTQGFAPRPMQVAAVSEKLFDGQNMVLIEDGTGSGKTEAALLLASRMMQAGLGEGVYVALPTMATANAMEARLRKLMPMLFDESGSQKASLILAHGKAEVARGLERLAPENATLQSARQAEADSVANRLNHWIKDSRKKTFFADAGVGTVDQALVGILNRKHLTLRQYALAGRILIIDEAHAYDAFTGTELEVLIESHAAHGGSLIVLTATLTLDKRRAFVDAFRRGTGGSDNVTEAMQTSTHYPLLTVSGRSALSERAVDALGSRRVGVKRLEDRQSAVQLVMQAAEQGTASAMICNAVDEALAMHGALHAAGHPPDKLMLFHARMAMRDRLSVENEVLRRFGKDSTPQDRAGQILVATQVVEQSLDIDFDVIVSDLAPCDLIIQRAGRLHRHKRQERVCGEPVLHVVSPDPHSITQKNWLEETLGKASFIYAADVNWRSAVALFKAGQIEMPKGLRALVEAAYPASGMGEPLPKVLIGVENTTLGKAGAHRTLAHGTSITPSAGYEAVGNVIDSEDLGTRLGDASITIRLARRGTDGVLRFWAHDTSADDQVLAAALSEISVRATWFCGKASGNQSFNPPKASDSEELKALRAGWPKWEDDITLYEVLEDGRLAFADGGGDMFRYTAARGLEKLIGDLL
jgi:CRISPR-associated endonuclease/helicase Cas3